MKILVLGGTRYFGRRLVDLLSDEGHDVTVASSGKTAVAFKRPVERIKVDRKDAASMHSALGGRGWDVVYDQICFDEASAVSAIETFGSRIGRLVFTSSQSIYGYRRDIKESDFCASDYDGNPNNENPYQEGKRLAERAYARQNLFPVATVRFPIVLGYDDPTGRLHWHVAGTKYGDPIYFPNIGARLSFICAAEAAAFLAWLKNAELTGPINAASPESVQLRGVMDIVEQKVGKPFIAASEASQANHSPFGVGEDWYMNVQRAANAGFTFDNASTWLTEMIGELAGRVTEANRSWSHPGMA